LAIQEITRG
jgi:importin subunit beta-1